MKNLKNIILAFSVVVLLSCGMKEGSETNSSGSGSESQTTPNDSSGADSRKAMGVGEDNQNEVSGYPSNQSNLNSDSTRTKHDIDTTTKGSSKDKPNKHQSQ
ncbi:hypothetical protein [Dyadobacter sp. CY312]|uniref:hypothetical protein n=1 Tax=Dyadobacter sp. CY312 TaxID=2907303 RepID=UPI001F1CC637|nr:hypothetical protein [Dyadobacter sp. CY312]MCE7042857.1 hypothetical protein [Dyadobacter sp. CY312]